MKTFLLFILLVTLAFASSPQSDIIGTWAYTPSLVINSRATFTILSGGTTFRADGTFTGRAAVLLDGSEVKVKVKGTWIIEQGLLIEKITHSTQHALVPVVLVTRDTIVRLDSESLTLRNELGNEHTETKEKPSIQ